MSRNKDAQNLKPSINLGTFSLLHSTSTTWPSLVAFIAVHDVIHMKQSDWSASIVALGTEIE